MARFVPTKVYHEFLKFLNQDQVDEKFFYSVDEDGKEHLTRHVVEKSKRDLKATISLFEKLYPEWFDPITTKKLKDTGGDEQSIGDIIRDAFSLKYPDKENPDAKTDKKEAKK